MPWVLTNDKNYLRKNNHNEMKTCSSASKATCFDTYKTAEKALMALPKTMRHLGYHPSLIKEFTVEDEIQQVEREIQEAVVLAQSNDIEMIAEQKPVADPVYEPIQLVAPASNYRHKVDGINDDVIAIDTFVSKMSEFSEFISAITEQKNTLMTAQNQAELEIQDILHGIEFSKCNVVGGYQWYKMLRDALQRRREYKDAIKCTEIVGELNVSYGSATHIVRSLEGMKHRRYTPRVLTELSGYFQECASR